MSKATWTEVYNDAWARYYSDEHVETIMRRAIASGINRTKIIDALTVFSGAARIENVHPLQFGFVRRKLRTQRRHGMKVVNPIFFYPWRAFDFVRNAARWGLHVWHYRQMMKRVAADPAVASYMDEALMPTQANEALPNFVQAFADKIPNTYGAPARAVAAAK